MSRPRYTLAALTRSDKALGAGKGRRTATLFSVVVLLTALAACNLSGSGGSDEVAESFGDFNPVLELKNESIEPDDEQTRLTVDAKVPIVSGVEQEYADAFTNGFKEVLTEKLSELSQLSSEEQSACAGNGNQCKSSAAFEMAAAQIYGDYATISYELTADSERATAQPGTFAESLTMNMRTGKVAEPSDFIDPDAPDLSAAITDMGECMQDYASDVDASTRMDAFSPTGDGMYLSWDAGTFSDAACGVGKVTLPWKDFGLKGQPDTRTSSEPTGAATTPNCADDPRLPEGVDGRVCEESPGGARELAEHSSGFAEFATPSENIMCELADDYVECLMIEPSTRVGLPLDGKATTVPGSAPVTTWDRETLDYGEAGTFASFTCISQEVGLSCWNNETKHGMFLSRAEVVLW